MKRLASWNVNGIRACVKKGFKEWLSDPNFLHHIVCLQETKAQDDQVMDTLNELSDYYIYSSSAVKKGYSGVALLSKKSLGKPKVTLGLGVKKFDDEGRLIIAEYKNFIVFNGYFPNGQRDHGRVPYKLSFSRAVVKKALELKEQTGKEVIICGDINTAHKEIDLKNPKTNKDTTGFLPRERKWIDELLQQGFVDCFREKNGDAPEHYTWWTYRGDCRERNIGWRIDYFFTSIGLKKKISNCFHRPEVMGSDHCPIYLEIKV